MKRDSCACDSGVDAAGQGIAGTTDPMLESQDNASARNLPVGVINIGTATALFRMATGFAVRTDCATGRMTTLARFPAGRILLHLLAMAGDRCVRFHAAGIVRELSTIAVAPCCAREFVRA